ncbi:MAG: TIGR03435 family protein [Terriglobia bacterium]
MNFIMAPQLNPTAVFRPGTLMTAIKLVLAAGTFGICLMHTLRIHAQSAQTPDAPPPSFEVASIKPNHSGDMRIMMRFQPGTFRASGATVQHLIMTAYDVKDFQVTHGPAWTTTEKYDIEAKEPDAVVEQMQKGPSDQTRKTLSLMLQSLLAERFQLKLSHTTKEVPAYALVVAKNGPKLQESKPGDTYQTGIKDPNGKPIGQPGMIRMGPGDFIGQGLTIAAMIGPLSQRLGRPVFDHTGLTGTYDFTLKWTPDPSAPAMIPGGGPLPPPNPGVAPPPVDPNGPTIFTAIQEQLGLKLESTKGPEDVLIVDHVERPTED